MAGEGDVRTGLARMSLYLAFAFPLLFIGLSALAGTFQSRPTDASRGVGLLFAGVLLVPAVLLLAIAARGFSRSSVWAVLSDRAWLLYCTVVGCFAVGALPLVSAVRSDYVSPSVVELLVGAVALEAGFVVLLATATRARRALLIVLALLAVAGMFVVFA
ncbi:MAG: hypothetical protein ACJ76D_03770 [Solirubrobacterales bacterium]